MNTLHIHSNSIGISSIIYYVILLMLIIILRKWSMKVQKLTLCVYGIPSQAKSHPRNMSHDIKINVNDKTHVLLIK